MLEQIFTKVGERINEEWPRVYADSDPVTIEITDDAVNYSEAPPRVVFCPRAERYGSKEVASRDGHKQPGQLFTRSCSVEVHVWGEDRTITEELLHAVIRAAYDLTYGSFAVDGGRWMPRSTTKLGNVYLLDLRFSIPVTRLPDASRLLTDLPTTVEIVDPTAI